MRKLSVMLALLLFAGSAWGAVWEVPGDFPTIQAAIDSSLVIGGDKLMVAPGERAGAVVDKAVEIKGEGGATITSGPPYGPMFMGFYIVAAGSGATISHFNFTVDFPVMAKLADDITVTQCKLINPLQGISNWAGSGWEISHNEILDLRTQNGGGIAILVGDYLARVEGVCDNVVSHNKIIGTLHVHPDDGGGYNGTGIVLYADFRWGAAGAEAIKDNRVVKNKISLNSDTPEVVDVAAIELTDSRDATADVIFDNAIGFNDLRGTVLQIALTPLALGDVNKISRNLGDNRGQGLHPSLFRPGGN